MERGCERTVYCCRGDTWRYLGSSGRQQSHHDHHLTHSRTAASSCTGVLHVSILIAPLFLRCFVDRSVVVPPQVKEENAQTGNGKERVHREPAAKVKNKRKRTKTITARDHLNSQNKN